MFRIFTAAMLLTTIGISPCVAPLHAGVVSATPDPAPDDPHRAAKIADRKRVAELNAAQARATARRDRSKIGTRNAANARAHADHAAAMAAWRRRVAACRGGDWNQCDR